MRFFGGLDWIGIVWCLMLCFISRFDIPSWSSSESFRGLNPHLCLCLPRPSVRLVARPAISISLSLTHSHIPISPSTLHTIPPQSPFSLALASRTTTNLTPPHRPHSHSAHSHSTACCNIYALLVTPPHLTLATSPLSALIDTLCFFLFLNFELLLARSPDPHVVHTYAPYPPVLWFAVFILTI